MPSKEDRVLTLLPCLLPRLVRVGIDCAICSEGYTAQLGFTCRDCSDSAGGIAIASFIVVATVFGVIVVVSYVVSGEVGDKGHRFAVQLKRYIPLQSVKIVIVAWQILTQVRGRTRYR